jgi:hypothetical protein
VAKGLLEDFSTAPHFTKKVKSSIFATLIGWMHLAIFTVFQLPFAGSIRDILICHRSPGRLCQGRKNLIFGNTSFLRGVYLSTVVLIGSCGWPYAPLPALVER